MDAPNNPWPPIAISTEARIAAAAGVKGATCSGSRFIRDAGTVHSIASRLNSDHVDPVASPARRVATLARSLDLGPVQYALLLSQNEAK